jgi:hypothetical protein
MEQIKRVIITRSSTIVNIVGANTVSGRPYFISIITDPNKMQIKEFNTLSGELEGYYQPRVFYSPKYEQPKKDTDKPDLRATLYWDNNVETDENGEATLKFYNADKPGKIRANIEGITVKGVPVAGATIYNVH